MQNSNIIELVGYANGLGAQDIACGQGPHAIEQSIQLAKQVINRLPQQFHTMINPDQALAPKAAIIDCCQRLANVTHHLVLNNQKFIVLGGDHSSAIGTWSGVSAALHDTSQLGLVWIDAHMDSHTPGTSHSQAIHGMPLAALLGFGETCFTEMLSQHSKLQPEHVVLIGIRSYEPEEQQRLQDLNVRIYYMEEIQQRGLAIVMQEAHAIVNQATAGYGVTIDLDALDPIDAPGVGSPVQDGLRLQQLCQSLTVFKNDPCMLGLEIAEFNPDQDEDNKTEQAIFNLIQSTM